MDGFCSPADKITHVVTDYKEEKIMIGMEKYDKFFDDPEQFVKDQAQESGLSEAQICQCLKNAGRKTEEHSKLWFTKMFPAPFIEE